MKLKKENLELDPFCITSSLTTIEKQIFFDLYTEN